MTHPDIGRTYITRPCDKCDGAGEHIVNDTNPFGFGPDPQCDESIECDACNGEGEIVIWRDPLVVMNRHRLSWRFWPGGWESIRRRMAYGTARQIAVSPVHLPDMPVSFRLEDAA